LGRTVGVAPEATWFACANLQRNLANPALYLDCMQFMLAPFPPGGDPLYEGDPQRAAHVLNNSWGCPWEHEGCDPPSLQPATQALRAAGIFVVASAGNEGPACGTVRAPLAIYDEALSVGAVDQANNLAIFSSAGPVTVDGSGRVKPDIVAPGVDVLSAYPGDSYSTADGTSMAGPHIAGVVALMWSANPQLIGEVDRTEQILLETAVPFSGELSGIDVLPTETNLEDEQATDFAAQIDEWLFDLDDACLNTGNVQQRPNNVAGYGIVDAYSAVQRALAEP
jgi:subtilisin family serine protease